MDALACWLRADPDALRVRSLREPASRVHCSHEQVRLAANALGIDTSRKAKEPAFGNATVARSDGRGREGRTVGAT